MTNITALPSVEDWNATVAANIRAELARDDINQAQAATALGVSEMWVSRRLKGGVKLDADDIMLFARFLGVSVDVLFRATKKAPTANGEGQDVHPLGLEPRTHWIRGNVHSVDFGGRPQREDITVNPVVAIAGAR